MEQFLSCGWMTPFSKKPGSPFGPNSAAASPTSNANIVLKEAEMSYGKRTRDERQVAHMDAFIAAKASRKVLVLPAYRVSGRS